MKSSYIQLKMKDCNKLKQQKNITKKNKKRTKLVDFVDRRVVDCRLLIKKLKA